MADRLDEASIELARIISGRKHSPVVYFAHVGNQVKIGTTTNLADRMRGLSLDLSHVARVLPGGAAVEREIHRQFADYRVSGAREWFWVKGDLRKFLQAPGLIRRLLPARPRAVGSGNDLVSVKEVFGRDYDRRRQQLRRDPDGPRPVHTVVGGPNLYRRDDLTSWAAQRDAERADQADTAEATAEETGPSGLLGNSA